MPRERADLGVRAVRRHGCAPPEAALPLAVLRAGVRGGGTHKFRFWHRRAALCNVFREPLRDVPYERGREEGDGAAYLAEEFCGVLRVPLLCLVVDVRAAKPGNVAVRPLKIIEETCRW